MDVAAQSEYLDRLDAELRSADAELTELQAALCGPGAFGGALDDVPELAWARARCDALRSWVEVLQRRDAARLGAPLPAFASEDPLQDPLHAQVEQARAALLRARLEVHERLQLLRQECAFRFEAQLRALEDGYAHAEEGQARALRPDRALQLSLGWLRCELHATWRLLERMLRAEDRDWARCRRDFERALTVLSRTARRLLPPPGRMRYA